MKVSLEEIKEAYVKLKSYIYYDNAELIMREQLVEFETNKTKDIEHIFILGNLLYNDFTDFKEGNIVESKLKVITERLNIYMEEPEFFDKLINKVDTIFFPKKYTNNSSKDIITNKRVKENYELERITAFIVAPIEIHLLSVLWIMKKGVSLDNELYEGCLGNRLLLNKNKDKIVKGSALFKPYFKQYQKWRDNSVSIAQELLSNDKNVLFLNLDVKDYFHSTRISSSYFPTNRLGTHFKETDLYDVNEILLKVHRNYTEKISKKHKVPNAFYNELKKDNEKKLEEFILPIGLLSSYVIANDYLKKFDKLITEKYKPAYYSRYVDDILIVISDPNPFSFNDQINKDFNFSFEKYKNYIEKKDSKINFVKEDLNDIELYILNNFNPLINLVDSPFTKNPKKPEGRIFKLNGYDSLYCQSDKTILHYFDSEESDLVIDKLKKELDEKTSEFRDLPSDSEGLVDFQNSAYHLNYEGNEGKIRTLKDYKENRYGLTVYLTNKIYISLRKENIISEKEKNQILKFFKGENCLEFYRLWERIFTLFLINKQPKAYTEFYCHCLEQINKLGVEELPLKTIGTTGVVYSEVKATLTKYLNCIHELVFSLNPKFIKSVENVERDFEFKLNKILGFISFHSPHTSNWTMRYREANMMRHQYVIIPLLNYTENLFKNEISLVDSNFKFETYIIDNNLLNNSPRPIRFNELCQAEVYQRLSSEIKVNIDGFENKQDGYYSNILDSEFEYKINESGDIISEEKTYLDTAFELYLIANHNHRSNYDPVEALKNKFFKHTNKIDKTDSIPFLREIKVSADNNFIAQPRISFANTEVKDVNILNSIRKSPNLTSDRYQKISSILKQARKEDSEILIFPECFIPINLLSTLTRFSQQNQCLLITGLEHIVVHNIAYNFVVTILPFELDGIKDATVIFRLKNNYSPDEERLILKNHLIVPKPNMPRLDIFNWKNIYFSISYCFEMANISYRSQLKGKIDLLIGIEYNRDISYFSNIVESATRDLHCFVAQVNTSHYGDSRLSKPSESAKKDLLRLKGGTNDTILVSSIDIYQLREFQRLYTLLNTNNEFKPLPPDFKLSEVYKRINNQ
jgi:hypothetical protein